MCCLGESRRGLSLSDRQDPSSTPNDADVTAELQVDGVKDINSSPRPSASGDALWRMYQVENDPQSLLDLTCVTEGVHRLRALTSDAYVNSELYFQGPRRCARISDIVADAG